MRSGCVYWLQRDERCTNMTTMDLACDHCGVPFRARQRADKPRRYCSRACRDDHRTTRVTLTCVECLQPFQRKAYQEHWSTDRGPFCSIPCHTVWQRRANDPNGYSSQHHKRQTAAALARDGRQCVECGSTKPLHVHHRVPWQAGQTDPHALGNLVTLCVRHHYQAHRVLASLSQP